MPQNYILILVLLFLAPLAWNSTASFTMRPGREQSHSHPLACLRQLGFYQAKLKTPYVPTAQCSWAAQCSLLPEEPASLPRHLQWCERQGDAQQPAVAPAPALLPAERSIPVPQSILFAWCVSCPEGKSHKNIAIFSTYPSWCFQPSSTLSPVPCCPQPQCHSTSNTSHTPSFLLFAATSSKKERR